MFDILKKKISDFVSSLKKTKSEKEGEREMEREGEKEEKIEEKKIEEKLSEEKKYSPSILTKVKGILFREITISEKDVKDIIEDLKFQLLEADVAYEVSEEFCKEIKERIVGRKINYNEFDSFVKNEIKNSLLEIIKQEKLDLISEIKKSEKPYKILFVGPNGHGKTTTIAKIAHFLKKNNLTCVISASDTFRAAAIEQTKEHGEKVGVEVIKQNYGSDPAAVAFDAVAHAKAKKIDVVLIDTAGRQETNKNLIEEMKKIERVIKPNLKLFVGEAIVGNAIINQIKEFNIIGLDGVILTKIDCDSKGGNVISIKKVTNLPILFLGTGQKYDDLMEFNENFVIKNIIS